MCQSDSTSSNAKPSDDFPFHIATYDAHCHPTDHMASLARLSTARATALIIMATRSQDQHLVSETNTNYGIKDRADLRQLAASAAAGSGGDSGVRRDCKVVPAFGWHPWFSYQLYDDTATNPTYKPDDTAGPEGLIQAKRDHYRAVLSPSKEDNDFFDSLPIPNALSAYINATRGNLESHPTALVGEIGLDKPFRLPQHWDPSALETRDPSVTPGTREGRQLSPYRVSMSHQQAILTAQLRLAGEMNRPVSVHGVQAHGVLFDTISKCWAGYKLHIPSRRERRQVAPGAEDFDSDSDSDNDELANPASKSKDTQQTNKPFPPRICLHSYSGSVDLLTQWMQPTSPCLTYVSFSSAVNLSSETVRARVDDVIRAIPDDRILVESDLDCAGDAMDAALEVMYRRICTAKGWKLEDGVAKIAANFETFVFGKL